MKKFYIENGNLKVGQPIERGSFYADNTVQDYNIMHQDPQPGIYSEEKAKDVKQKLDQFNQFMNLQIKTTPDHKYCAVYSPNYLYCDFYEQLEPEKYMPIVKSDNDPLYVDRARAQYSFTLKRNTYRPGDFIVEFVTHPTSKETMILFNDTHGQISVYNTKGQLIHKEKEDDKFIRNLEIINEKYMIAHCWVWHPIEIKVLYNIDDLVTKPDYHPITIWREEDEMIYEIIDNDKIKFSQINTYTYSNEYDPEYHKVIKECTYPLDEAYHDYRYIMQSQFTEMIENWQKDNLFKKIFNGKQYNKTNITIQSPEKIELLKQWESGQRIFIDCIDNTDGYPRDLIACRMISIEDSEDLPQIITIARFFHLNDDRDVDISLIIQTEQVKLTCKMNIKMIDKKYSPECVLDIVIS
ncbi:hypothetical protein Klosneuvirus_3_310 [Klosneuvirus KNV1]|uniref:Uncharacterized protein n=1 Tax=Klosneuvirus KNV1 TaxID=1977640 RepID=A0A1V0SKA6_9VIRU|nr:hypothetical protein Klosneuvirus_3_310 [Klosneuvirus KNV1]